MKKPREHRRKEQVVAVKPPVPASAGGALKWLGTPLLQLVLVAVAGLLAYGNTFEVPFVFDDETSIVNNPAIRDLGRFLAGEGYAYNPRRFVGYLTFALNYQLGGLDVIGYHIVNLAIHIISGLLVYALGWLAINAASQVNSERGKENGNDSLTPHPSPLTAFIPLFAALLFVVHPIQTQAVTYIVQRLASLATLFYLGAVVCYAKGRAFPSGDQGPGTGDRENRVPFTFFKSPYLWYALALVSGLLALKTKEIAVTLPLAIILYEFIFFGFSGRKLLILLAPLLLGAVVGAIGLVFTDKPLGVLLSDVTEMGRETTVISRFDYLVTQFSVIATYLRLLVLPVNQNLDYDYPVYHSLLQPKPLLGLLLHLTLIGVAIYAWIKAGEGRRAKGERQQEGTSSGGSLCPSPGALRLVSFGILWFYLTLSVESSIIPITDVIFEHRAYLPSVGFVMAVTAGMTMLARTLPGRVLATVGALLLLGLLVTTIHRNQVWQSQLSLWGDSLTKSPNKMRPYYNVGCEYAKQNDIDKAIIYLNKAVSLKEDQYQCHTNLGAALLKVKRIDEAMYHLQRAIELNPSSAMSHFNLGLVYALKGRSDEAFASVEKAIALNPANQEYRKNLEILRGYLQQ